ncbi:endonuclease/exonuclease/phosphatase family protein [uncultured Brevundimonas sp.]|uniref:endonuclease/exonuclease/phosphatase family protein n=1 Tax=uncultured Brevundimonas sp. TaxID=213418 RepID=UPI00262E8D21|nr:endonuclease/exonuclease/phosphatase family protein [uncultured Brevundimonas sp.]
MKRLHPALVVTFEILATGVTLAPLGVAVASLIQSDHRWPDLANQFTAPALLACVAWAVLLLVLRLRVSAMFASVTAAALLVAVWPQWFPKTPQPDPASEVITVYSANLWARNTDVDAMARSIAAADADIILLVELGDVPAEDLDRLLPDHPFRKVSIVGNRNVAPARAMVASRWPIDPLRENTRDQLFSAEARVRTPIGRVGVMAAHLTRPWPYRYQWAQINQTTDMEPIRKRLGDDVIIAGDFNTVSSGRIGRQIKDNMDLLPAPGFPGTWPSKLPSAIGITIDQVWYSPTLSLVERRLGMPNGSDHRPVITRFRRAQSEQ